MSPEQLSYLLDNHRIKGPGPGLGVLEAAGHGGDGVPHAGHAEEDEAEEHHLNPRPAQPARRARLRLLRPQPSPAAHLLSYRWYST